MYFLLTTLGAVTSVTSDSLKTYHYVKFQSSPLGGNSLFLNTVENVVDREKVNEYSHRQKTNISTFLHANLFNAI